MTTVDDRARRWGRAVTERAGSAWHRAARLASRATTSLRRRR